MLFSFRSTGRYFMQMLAWRWLLPVLAVALMTTSADAQRRSSRAPQQRRAPLHQDPLPPADPDSVAAAETQPEPGPWHGDIDFAAGYSMVRFLTMQEISRVCMPGVPCALPSFNYTTLRGTVGIGWKSMALEGGVAIGVNEGSQPSYFVWRAGFRIESGWKSIFSVMFRFQWVYRTGDLQGMGASASMGFLVRPIQLMGIYGEAACDFYAVPPWATQAGGIFAYTPIFTGGIRFQFGH